MSIVIAYLKIIRPVNAVLAATGVSLGFWLTGNNAPVTGLVLLVIATICALGFGNVINDIKDAEGDRINHPGRPLPNGEISPLAALIFASLLATVSLITSINVSLYHCFATLVPLVLLILYTLFFKGVPLLGNIIISLLVAYTIVFGGLSSPDVTIILAPAFLAFLLNLSREIVKDMEDKEGDLKAGVHTTATLSDRSLKTVLFIPGLLYMPLIYIPYFLGHFHWIYLVICIAVLLPLHIFWFLLLVKKNNKKRLGQISTAIKIEMLGGLAALAIDKIFFNTFC